MRDVVSVNFVSLFRLFPLVLLNKSLFRNTRWFENRIVLIMIVAVLDPCMAKPCQNNGTCILGSGNYSCDCLPGTSGTHCETGQSAPLFLLILYFVVER